MMQRVLNNHITNINASLVFETYERLFRLIFLIDGR